MTTRAAELAWFHEHAPTWNWTWAKTFEKGAPHSYVIRDRSLNRPDYQRAFRLSQMLGRPRKFYKRVNIELECPDLTMVYGKPGQTYEHTGFKFWPMTHQTPVSKSFNVAPLGLSYGHQDAPDTTTEVDHPFDFNAPDWDTAPKGQKMTYGGLEIPIWKSVLGERHIPSMLDVGPRIGLALDMNLMAKGSAYRAVEPSQGMLNQLLYRHQWVRDIYPMTVDDYLAKHGGRFDTAVALMGTASYLTPEAILTLASVVRFQNLMFYTDRNDDWFGPTHLPSTAGDALRTAAALPGAQVSRMGRYVMVKVGG